MQWIDLAQEMEKWQAVVSTVMNLCVPLNAGDFLPRLASQKWLCCMELAIRNSSGLTSFIIKC